MSWRAAIVGCAGLLAGCAIPETPSPPERVPVLAPPAPERVPVLAPAPTLPLPPVPSDIHAPPARGPLDLAFVGDIILGKYRLHDYASLVTPGEDPFAAVVDLLRADIAVANLETPLMHTRPPRSPIYIGSRFGADKQAARALVGRFTALGVANDHAHDLLTAGLQQTPRSCASSAWCARRRGAGHRQSGAGRHARAGRLARRAGRRDHLDQPPARARRPRAAGLPPASSRVGSSRQSPRPARARPRARAAPLGSGVHQWPRPPPRAAARRLIDGGADLVIGHHPHILHGLERHGDGLIAYSLGNFLFANTNERSRHSGVLRVRYRPGQRCPERASFHPVWLGEAPTRPRPRPRPAPPRSTSA